MPVSAKSGAALSIDAATTDAVAVAVAGAAAAGAGSAAVVAGGSAVAKRATEIAATAAKPITITERFKLRFIENLQLDVFAGRILEKLSARNRHVHFDCGRTIHTRQTICHQKSVHAGEVSGGHARALDAQLIHGAARAGLRRRLLRRRILDQTGIIREKRYVLQR